MGAPPGSQCRDHLHRQPRSLLRVPGSAVSSGSWPAWSFHLLSFCLRLPPPLPYHPALYRPPGNGQLSLGYSVLPVYHLWDAGCPRESRSQRLAGPQSGSWALFSALSLSFALFFVPYLAPRHNLYFGASPCFPTKRAQAWGCLVKWNEGREERRKEGARDFLEGSLGIRTSEQERMLGRFGGSMKPRAP